MSDPQDASRRNQRERAAAVERVLREADPDLEAHSYPVRREELAARYGDTTVELPNETESLGDVFDRLTDGDYETAREARAAAIGEIAGVPVDADEYNIERELDPETAGHLGTVEDPLAGDDDSPIDTEPRSAPEAVPDEPDPDGVYDGAEAVEPDDREAGSRTAEEPEPEERG